MSNTDCRSPGDVLMTFSTSLVAVCCSRASASSRVRAVTCSCKSAFDERLRRATAIVAPRFGFGVLPRRAFAALPPVVARRFMPAPGSGGGIVPALTSTLVGGRKRLWHWPMSALGHKATWRPNSAMSAVPPLATEVRLLSGSLLRQTIPSVGQPSSGGGT
jgi:hypothetical protein